MSRHTVDIENTNKNYLNEKELFIIYALLKKKHISTEWSNVFTPDGKFSIIPLPTNGPDIATFEDNVNESIQRTNDRVTSKMQSSIVARYLLETGKLFDENNFKLYGNADYSLVEGGFLSEYVGETMREYLEDTKENKNNTEKYGMFSIEQTKFLDEIIKGKDLDSAEFSRLAHPPVKEYRDAVINKEADKDFIELVSKLITEYDGSRWTKEDIENFFEIYYRHNKEEFRNNTLTEKTWLYEDSQTKLSKLIFQHTDFGLKLENVDKIEKYLNEYINCFENDKLNGLSNVGLTRTFFSESSLLPLHSKYFGIKKQKDILKKHIDDKYEEYQRTDLEIGHPFFEPEYIGNDIEGGVTIKGINEKDGLFLFVHTMLVLEKDGYLTIEDFSYGPKGLFDLYDRGFLFGITLNSVPENKQVEAKVKLITEQINTVLFDSESSAIVCNGSEIKITKGKDIYYTIKYLFEREGVYEDCFYDEIRDSSELDDGKERTDKNIYDALMQFNKRLVAKGVDDLLIINFHSIKIRNKYKIVTL